MRLNKISSLFISFVVILSCVGSRAAENETIKNQVTNFLSMHPQINGIFKVTQRDQDIAVGSVGFFDLVTKEKLSQDQAMPIASGTKQMTAAMIMRLQERGILNISDTIGKLLPSNSNWWPNGDVPEWARKISIHHLLTHTSGLAEYILALKFDKTSSHQQIKHAIIEYAINTPLTHEPGEVYAYNNTGYFFLGLIIEHITKKDLAEVFKAEFFEPLEMKNTHMANLEEAIKFQEGKLKNYPNRYFGIPTGAVPKYLPAQVDFLLVPYADGGVISTVDDLIKWNKAFHRGKVVSATSYQLMTTPYHDAHHSFAGKTMTGYGVYIRTLDNQKIAYYHSGKAVGIRCEHGYIPEDDIAFAILSNVMLYEDPTQKDKIDYNIVANQFDIVYLREALFKAGGIDNQ